MLNLLTTIDMQCYLIDMVGDVTLLMFDEALEPFVSLPKLAAFEGSESVLVPSNKGVIGCGIFLRSLWDICSVQWMSERYEREAIIYDCVD